MRITAQPDRHRSPGARGQAYIEPGCIYRDPLLAGHNLSGMMFAIGTRLNGHCPIFQLICVDQYQSNAVRLYSSHEGGNIFRKPCALFHRVKIPDLGIQR